MVITEEKIRHWLKEVSDPEIPVLSLMDLGIITNIKVSSEGKVKIDMTPTFAGCPAIDYMKNDVIRVLEKNGVENECLFRDSMELKYDLRKRKKGVKRIRPCPSPHAQLASRTGYY